MPFFFKQWGGRTPAATGHLLDGLVHHGMPPAEPAGHTRIAG
ncbi:MAG TPA: hypothetical protein PLJ54_10100 [Rhodoglobus sp.]|nr:hypothetical protein [Rhodoglobus sp.]